MRKMKNNERDNMIYGWVMLNLGTMGKMSMIIALRMGPLYHYPFSELLFLYGLPTLIIFYVYIYFSSTNLKKIWRLSKWTYCEAIGTTIQYYIYFSALTKIGFGDAVAVYVTAGK